MQLFHLGNYRPDSQEENSLQQLVRASTQAQDSSDMCQLSPDEVEDILTLRAGGGGEFSTTITKY